MDGHYRHVGIQLLGRNLVSKIKGTSMSRDEEGDGEDHVSERHKL